MARSKTAGFSHPKSKGGSSRASASATAQFNSTHRPAPNSNIPKLPANPTLDEFAKAWELDEPKTDLGFFGRAGKTLTGSLKGYGGSQIATAGAMQGLGNALHADSSETDRAIVDSGYSGFATDPLAASIIADGGKKYGPNKGNRGDGGLFTLKKEEKKLYDKADKLSAESAKDISEAKAGLGKIGSAAVDLGVNATQMALDAVGRATGLGMLPFASRAFGSGAQQARQEGANAYQAALYGTGKAGVELATEKLFDGVAGIFGKGFSDDAVEWAIKKAAKKWNVSDKGKSALRFLMNTFGEGAEEGLSDLADPILKKIYSDEKLSQMYREMPGELVYDILLGMAMGGLGGAGAAITGQNKPKNAAINEALRAEIEGETKAPKTSSKPVAETAPKPIDTVGIVTQTAMDGGIPKAEVQETVSSTNPVREKLNEILSGGRSNSQVEQILADPELRAEFEQLSGVELTGTKAEQRRIIKNFNTEISEESTSQPETAAEPAPIQNLKPQNRIETSESVITPPEVETAQKPLEAVEERITETAEIPQTAQETAQNQEPQPQAQNPTAGEPAAEESNVRERGFSHNIRTDDFTDPVIKAAFEDNPLMYEQLRNKGTLQKAIDLINSSGMEEAINIARARLNDAKLDNKKISPDTVPLVKIVTNELAKQNRVKEAVELETDLAAELSYAGQFTQAARILRYSSPSDVLIAVQKTVDKINTDLAAKKKGKKKGKGNEAPAQATAEDVEAVKAEAQKEATEKLLNENADSKGTNSDNANDAAKQVANMVKSALKEKEVSVPTAEEILVSNIKKFAREKLPKRAKKPQLTATDIVKSYVNNPEYFTDVWQEAQGIVKEDYKDATFVKEGIAVNEKNRANSKIFARAVADAAIDLYEDTSMIRQQRVLGASAEQIAEHIANGLIAETGAKDEIATVIRESAIDHVNKVLGIETDKVKTADQIVSSAMRETGSSARDTALSAEAKKAETLQSVKDMLISRYSLSEADAERLSKMVSEEYQSIVSGESEKILEQRYGEKDEAKEPRPKLRRFEEDVNLGAFEGQYANKAATNALHKVVNDADESKSMMRSQRDLGAKPEEISKRISDELISQAGIDLSGNVTDAVRAAADAYVAETLETGESKSADKYVNSIMRQIGETAKSAALSSKGDKQIMQDTISAMLGEKYSLNPSHSERIAKIVTDEYGKLVSEETEKILEQRYGERKPGTPAEKAKYQKIIEAINLGAFDSEYAAKAINKEFGLEGQNTEGIVIPPELIEKFNAQEDDEGRDEVMKEIQAYIGQQLPSSGMDKINSLRYVNMLGNFKTQIRNLIGNAANLTRRKVSDVLKEVFEVASGAERTVSVFAGKKLYGEAAKDFNNKEVQSYFDGSGKFGDYSKQLAKGIRDNQTIFKFKPLEAYRKATNWAMEKGDDVFMQIAYANALGGWMKANHIDSLANASSEQLARGREFAIKEALESTFHEDSALSTALTRAHYDGDNAVLKAFSKFGEAVLPFRKTPANVLSQGLEASPIGVVRALYDAQKGNKTQSEVLSELSKGVTGTALMAAGMALRAARRARGAGDDDDKLTEYNNQMGAGKFSLDLNGNGEWTSIDWLAPTALPFFMGIALQDAIEGEGLNFTTGLKAFSGITNAMIEMSMLKGVADTLEDVGRATKNGEVDMDVFTKAAVSAATSYAAQLLQNSMLRSAEFAKDENRQTSYTEPDSKLGALQYPLSKLMGGGIPGDFQQQEYLDAWGRPQSNGSKAERIINSFVNPANTSKDRGTEIDGELERLYKETRDGDAPNVLPQRPSRSTSIDDKRLTPDEYHKYAQRKGQLSLELVTDFVKSSDYKMLTDSERAEVISDLYSFANSRAADTIRRSRGDKASKQNEDDILYRSGNLTQVKAFETAFTMRKDSGNSAFLNRLVNSYDRLPDAVKSVLDENSDIRQCIAVKNAGGTVSDFIKAEEGMHNARVESGKNNTATTMKGLADSGLSVEDIETILPVYVGKGVQREYAVLKADLTPEGIAEFFAKLDRDQNGHYKRSEFIETGNEMGVDGNKVYNAYKGR